MNGYQSKSQAKVCLEAIQKFV